MKAIFFDAAGTLITVREPVGVTYAQFANAHGISVSSDAVAHAFRAAWKSLPPPQHHGVPASDDERAWWRELVRRCFATALGAELLSEKLDPLFDELYAHYARHDAWTVFPDVVPALSVLREKQPLFVLSNFDERLRHILDGHGLTSFFESLVISSEVGASKPEALIFAAAAKAAGLPPRDCIHIGDDEYFDLEGARAAGFEAFLVRRPESGLDAIAQEVMARSVL